MVPYASSRVMHAVADSKVIAISGASSGIGRAVAAGFLDEGARISVLARRGQLLAELLREHPPVAPEGALAHTGDASVRADADAWIEATMRRFGRIDVLVCSAGMNIKNRALAHLTAEDWDRMLRGNLDSAFHCTHAALPHMRRQGGGLVIYVSSVSARHADASGAAYQAAKHGLTGLANAVRNEEQRNGIRATLIEPGVVNTPLVMQRPVPPTPEQLAIALQPADVAAAIHFVVSLPERVYVPELEMRAVTQL